MKALFTRTRERSQWKKEFMTIAIQKGLSFDAADKLSESHRAKFLREDLKASPIEAWDKFEF